MGVFPFFKYVKNVDRAYSAKLSPATQTNNSAWAIDKQTKARKLADNLTEEVFDILLTFLICR
jgi:hypothetical protein